MFRARRGRGGYGSVTSLGVAGARVLGSRPGSRRMRRGGAGRTIVRAYRDTMLLCMRREQDMDVATVVSMAKRPRDGEDPE